jgi:hypothetical protein
MDRIHREQTRDQRRVLLMQEIELVTPPAPALGAQQIESIPQQQNTIGETLEGIEQLAEVSR